MWASLALARHTSLHWRLFHHVHPFDSINILDCLFRDGRRHTPWEWGGWDDSDGEDGDYIEHKPISDTGVWVEHSGILPEGPFSELGMKMVARVYFLSLR